jgi:23S rRNA (cytosine1962-C5)-methyltransferase
MDGPMASLPAVTQNFLYALGKRHSLFAPFVDERTDAYRIFNGASDGIRGWIVDRFGPVAWIQWREGETEFDWEFAKEFCTAIAPALNAELGIASVILRRFVADRSSVSLEKAAAEDLEFQCGVVISDLVASENGLRFHIYPTESFSPGIFLDQRNNRAWVRERSAGKRVLNLYCYSGAFSVMAAAGGASEVTSVDISKRWMERVKLNFALNELPIAPHRFFSNGSLSFLATAKKRGEKYDLLLVDPPSFSRSEKDGVFSLKEDRFRLWELAADAVAPGGTLFFSTNWQQTNQQRLEQEMREVFGSKWKSVALPSVPADFEHCENPIAACAFTRIDP